MGKKATKTSGVYIVIAPDGEKEPVNTNKVSLEQAQALVGGYVEVVPGFNKYLGNPCVVLCDEEGKLKGKPYNNRATGEWHKCTGAHDVVLVGNILVLQGSAMNGWR